MKVKIGQEVVVQEDYEIKTLLSDKSTKVKKGDKGYVDSNGYLHFTKGDALGSIQALQNIELKGYDIENIAKLIFERLEWQLNLDECLEDSDIDKQDFMEELEGILTEIF